jgi:hypothetical protein
MCIHYIINILIVEPPVREQVQRQDYINGLTLLPSQPEPNLFVRPACTSHWLELFPSSPF